MLELLMMSKASSLGLRGHYLYVNAGNKCSSGDVSAAAFSETRCSCRFWTAKRVLTDVSVDGCTADIRWAPELSRQRIGEPAKQKQKRHAINDR